MITNKLSKTFFASLVLIILATLFSSCDTITYIPDDEISERIPIGLNTWIANNDTDYNRLISKHGIQNWNDTKYTFRIYFYARKKGDVNMGLGITTFSYNTAIELKLGNQSSKRLFNNPINGKVDFGKFTITKTGYQYIELRCLRFQGFRIANVKELFVSGPAALYIKYVPKEKHYSGDTGPSVHLSYRTPKNKKKFE